MNNRVRVPIRVQPGLAGRVAYRRPPPITETAPPVVERKPVTPARPDVVPVPPGRDEERGQRRPAPPRPDANAREGAQEETPEVWRDRALRLQAEMDNFRKRQRRLADERVRADRERLLRAVLGVSDDLERALAAGGTGVETLRQGVDLTHKGLMRIMDREGVEPIEAVGQLFDPALHEAVSTVPYEGVGAEPDTVVAVVQAGYRLDGRLLRAARVVVAI